METLDDVALFLRVAEAGSFSAAANQLNLSTSTISRRITQLESALDVRLVKRNTRQLTLSEAGHKLVSGLTGKIADIQFLLANLSEEDKALAGSVHLTMPHFLGMEIVAPWLIEFMEQYPEIQLQVNFENRNVDLVGSQVDLALRIGPLADSSFIGQKMIATDMGLYASPETPWANAQKPEYLTKIPGLFFHTQNTLWQLQHKQSLETFSVQSPIRLSEGEGIFVGDAAAKGLGVAGLPNFFCLRYLETGALVRVLPEYRLLPVRDVYLVYPNRGLINQRTRTLMDFLRSKFADLVAEVEACVPE